MARSKALSENLRDRIGKAVTKIKADLPLKTLPPHSIFGKPMKEQRGLYGLLSASTLKINLGNIHNEKRCL